MLRSSFFWIYIYFYPKRDFCVFRYTILKSDWTFSIGHTRISGTIREKGRAPTPTEKPKKQRDNTQTPPKTSITQQLRTDLSNTVIPSQTKYCPSPSREDLWLTSSDTKWAFSHMYFHIYIATTTLLHTFMELLRLVLFANRGPSLSQAPRGLFPFRLKTILQVWIYKALYD